MWRQRLLSPILSPGKFAEYLVDEFNKINAVCSEPPGTEPTATEVGELPSPVAKRADGVYDGALRKDCGEVCKSNNRCGPCDPDDLDPEDVTPTDTMPNNPASSTPVDFSPTKPVPELPAPSSTAPSNTFPSDSAQDDFATPEPAPTADDPTQGDSAPTKPVPPKETGRPDNATMAISVDGKCSLNVSCTGSSFGDCCSTSGYCGTGSDWCVESFLGYTNCYSGSCDTSLGGVSTDGTCGPNYRGNMTCVGSAFGECCSTSGFCGSSSRHCGIAVCYSGKCEGSTNIGDGGENGDKEKEDKGGEDKSKAGKDEEDKREEVKDKDADGGD
ncbi:conserved hypothetical protein [Histoplasma capsulatum var. duboisii H88]|uniref:Chitin-binding type-1 domain-containing protein n=1 Tax=Ajellomyces capsulatus (strain H88) TaxID=544711 RepID=F0U701_AJEC8|nr:conserved hypothetical protein [Histoplasma capsulatum var. duboisii H88]